MCQMPINATNWSVITIPKIMGIKSPNFLMDGKKSIGNDSKTRTIAITAVIEISFGRGMVAIFYFVVLFNYF